MFPAAKDLQCVDWIAQGHCLLASHSVGADRQSLRTNKHSVTTRSPDCSKGQNPTTRAVVMLYGLDGSHHSTFLSRYTLSSIPDHQCVVKGCGHDSMTPWHVFLLFRGGKVIKGLVNIVYTILITCGWLTIWGKICRLAALFVRGLPDRTRPVSTTKLPHIPQLNRCVR